LRMIGLSLRKEASFPWTSTASGMWWRTAPRPRLAASRCVASWHGPSPAEVRGPAEAPRLRGRRARRAPV
jgi:hypothetical protein